MSKSAPAEMAREPFALAALHPRMVGPISALLATLRTTVFTSGGKQCVFAAFEGFRHPVRQYDLFTRGKVTEAGPWQSAHQYGCAVDFACVNVGPEGVIVPGSWTWPDDAPWGKLKILARRVSLDVPIEKDKGHVQHPLWQQLRKIVL